MEIPGAVKRREKAAERKIRAGLKRKKTPRRRGETRSGEAAFPLPLEVQPKSGARYGTPASRLHVRRRGDVNNLRVLEMT